MAPIPFETGQVEVLEAVARGRPLPEILLNTVLLVESQSDGMICSILLLDDDGRTLRHGAAPRLPDAYNRAIDGGQIGPEAGSCGTAAFLRRRVIVTDIATNPYWSDYKHHALAHGLLACWSSPIFSPEGKVLGTFAMYYREIREPTPDEIHWVDTATHIASIAIDRDRSEQQLRQSEARFRRSESELRAIFESAAVGIAVVDISGRPVSCNPALLRMLGYSLEEFQSMTFAEFTHPEDIGSELERYQDLVTGRLDNYQIEKRFVGKDKDVVWGRLTASIVRDGNGAARFTLGIVEDITEQKRAADERARLEAQLHHAQRMEALGTLAGGIAHDFNNILMAILGNIHLAASAVEDNPPAHFSLSEIEKAATRAVDLVRQILTFSRRGEIKRRQINLRSVIEEALQLLRVSLPPAILTRTQFKDTPPVLADAGQIHQVVMNLVTNASQAIGEAGGRVDLSLEPIELPPGSVPELPPGRYVRLSVSDSGSGMDKETSDRIFEPFFTTKAQGQGTGLGLSVVHGIMEAQGGTITVYSEPGQGSTFQLYFPVAVSPTTEADPVAPQPIPGNGECILYVDDEESLVLLARQTLGQINYKVAAFTDPDEALKAFRRDPAGFDAVITDQSMPGVSGSELAAQIAAIRQDIPIIMITGHIVTPESLQTPHVRDWIQKPVTLADLSRVLQENLPAKIPASPGHDCG